MICVQPNGSGRFHFIRFGGVAHQTSLRSPSIMMTYSNSPHSGRRVAYSVTRSLQCRTTVVIWHSRMGFPALPLLSAAAELFVVNLVAQHDPQADTQVCAPPQSAPCPSLSGLACDDRTVSPPDLFSPHVCSLRSPSTPTA